MLQARHEVGSLATGFRRPGKSGDAPAALLPTLKADSSNAVSRTEELVRELFAILRVYSYNHCYSRSI